jgi:oxygen-independent coproporphyrinogen-3 oxidase
VPFCARRCSYCDFAIAVRREVPGADFVRGIVREIKVRAARQPAGGLDTLYFGGGTPSRLGGAGLAELVARVTDHLPVSASAEVTIEVNPEDVTIAAARQWAVAGVTRVSLGVQSFDDTVLRWMHRAHDAATAERAVHLLRDAGVGNLSLDLMYAMPEPVRRSWEADLHRAITLGPQHLSCYGLTVEPRTPLARWIARGESAPPDEGRYEQEFLRTHRELAEAGFEHYEVSNFARPGAQSRHNSAYWTGAAYLGLGPSAHGFDGVVRRWNKREYRGWLGQVEADVDPVDGAETLSDEQRQIEGYYLGLRCLTGVSLSNLRGFDPGPWVSEGWAEIRAQRLLLTPTGWLRLDALVAALTAHPSRY